MQGPNISRIHLALPLAAVMFGTSVAAWAQEEGSVARAMFTSAVEEREPVDTLERVPADTPSVHYFTELGDLTDRTVTHVWSHEGEAMDEVSFDVGGPRWRVWSRKTLRPEWAGEWTVTVVDDAGNELHSDRLTVGDAPAPEEPATEEPATQEPATQEPTAEEPTTDDPTTEDAAPASEEPVDAEESSPGEPDTE